MVRYRRFIYTTEARTPRAGFKRLGQGFVQGTASCASQQPRLGHIFSGRLLVLNQSFWNINNSLLAARFTTWSAETHVCARKLARISSNAWSFPATPPAMQPSVDAVGSFFFGSVSKWLMTSLVARHRERGGHAANTMAANWRQAFTAYLSPHPHRTCIYIDIPRSCRTASPPTAGVCHGAATKAKTRQAPQSLSAFLFPPQRICLPSRPRPPMCNSSVCPDALPPIAAPNTTLPSNHHAQDAYRVSPRDARIVGGRRGTNLGRMRKAQPPAWVGSKRRALGKLQCTCASIYKAKILPQTCSPAPRFPPSAHPTSCSSSALSAWPPSLALPPPRSCPRIPQGPQSCMTRASFTSVS